MVKNLPAMQESQVQSLGQEDPWKRKWQPSPVFFPREFLGQRNLGGLQSMGSKSRTRLTLSFFSFSSWSAFLSFNMALLFLLQHDHSYFDLGNLE